MTHAGRWRRAVASVVLAVVSDALVAACGDARAASVEPGAARSAKGPHVEIVCHFPGGRCAERALRVAEASWTIASRRFGVSAAPLGQPRQIHLYATAREYEDVEGRISQGRNRQKLSVAHFASRSAHIALQPPPSEEALEALGLPYQTLRLVAHETAHLAMYETFDNHRLHPEWFSEGVACQIESETVVAERLATSLVDDPHFSDATLRAQRALDEGRVASVAELLLDRPGRLDEVEGYDVRWMFFRYLVEKQPELLKVLYAGVYRLGSAGASLAGIVAAAAGTLRDPGLGSLNGAFRSWLRTHEPAWEEIGRSLSTAGARWAQHAWTDSGAMAWRRRATGGVPLSISGSLRILPGASQQLNVLLDRQREGHLSVAFRADVHSVSLLEYTTASGQWKLLTTVSAPRVVVDRAVAFRVQVTAAREVIVDVEGATVLRASMRGRSFDGAMGLAALAGSSGEWIDVNMK